MSLGVMLAGVREYGYQHTSGKDQPAQIHLRTVRRDLMQLVPLGMRVLVSGSGQSLPVVPWIAVLDTDVTTTAQEGLYVVYLYRRDLSRVYLSMNQGATQHLRNAENRNLKGKRAEQEALAELFAETTMLRNHLSQAALAGLQTDIELGAPDRFLPRGYEIGNIAAIEYDPAQLPDDVALRVDLARMIALYSSCVDIKTEILASTPEHVHTSARSAKKAVTPKPPIFRPKDSAAYLAEVGAQRQYRSRRHEELVAVFGEWMLRCDLVPATNVHPRDLTVDSKDQHWLIEAKTVAANAENAVREAIGQLFSYRHFWYRKENQPDPALVALFSEPVGEAFPPLLRSLGIECIWRARDEWAGTAPDIATSLLKTAQAHESR